MPNATIEIDIDLKAATPMHIAAALMHAASQVARAQLKPHGLAHLITVDGQDIGGVIAIPGVREHLLTTPG